MDKAVACVVGTLHEESDLVFPLRAHISVKVLSVGGVALELSNPLLLYGHKGTILPGLEIPKSVPQSLRIYFVSRLE